MSDQYAPVTVAKWQAMEHAFRAAPQDGGRFSGTPEQQRELARQIRGLFDDDPGDDAMYLDRAEVLGLADDLADAEPRWSIGQYLSALASLMKPEE